MASSDEKFLEVSIDTIEVDLLRKDKSSNETL